MPQIPVNLSGVQPAQNFVYPVGEYILQIEKADVVPTQDGGSFRLKVASKIIMGPGPSTEQQGHPIFHSYALSEKSKPFFLRFCIACGITPEMIQQAGGAPATEWFLSRTFMCYVSMRKDPSGSEWPNVDRETNVQSWGHGGVAGQQAAAPQSTLLPPVAMPQQYAQPAPAPASMPQYAPPAPPQAQYAPPQAQYAPPQAQYAPPQAQAPMMAPPQQAPAGNTGAPPTYFAPPPPAGGQQPH